MSRLLRAVLAAVAVAGFVVVPPARGGTGMHKDVPYVVGPGSAFTNYTVPRIVIEQGDTVTYHNADVMAHDVVSDVLGPDRPWCAVGGFLPGECPLIWSPLIALGRETPVYGVEELASGREVVYKCTIHPGMEGQLIVL